ncbi:MAG: DUF4249 domain-containing protein [Sphingobacteriaceae bacterium]|nr:DUF4249 domain-containing protein [Sphingobacteriaceae bacterium]
MLKILNIIWVTFVLIGFTSCEDVVQIKLDEGSKIYVIDAFVNDLRQNQIIKITTNDTYFSNRQAPPVSDAQVVLNDLTSSNSYTFNYIGNGNYTYTIGINDTIAKVNHQYRLDVSIDGNIYTSTSIQSRPSKIDSISVLPNDGGFGPPGDKDEFICLLFAKDKADNNPDYYWIKTFRNDTLFQSPNDLNICIDGTGGAVQNANSDSIYFTPPATFLGFKSYRKNNTCKVEVHSVNKETYLFFVQAFNQINNGGLFATTPENVKTNIISPTDAKTKAVGRFSMASVATSSVLIK